MKVRKITCIFFFENQVEFYDPKMESTATLEIENKIFKVLQENMPRIKLLPMKSETPP